MFTGIIQELGKISRLTRTNTGFQLGINPGSLNTKIKPSDSLAINGVCLTVTAQNAREALFDIMSETVKRTTFSTLKIGDNVNMEAAIRAGDPFGGHFVTGHIDGVGTILRKELKSHEAYLELALPQGLSDLMIPKGSIALDGISLTLIHVQNNKCSVALVPYTIKHTTLGKKNKGAKINIETDLLGKWIAKIIDQSRTSSHLEKYLTE
jgi:riboflavin synthase